MYKYNNNAKQRKDEKLFDVGGVGGLGVGSFCSFHRQDKLELGPR